MNEPKRFPFDTTSNMPDQQSGVIRLEETASDVTVRTSSIIHQAEWAQTIRIPIAELGRLRADVERLNQMLRDTGYGQGAIDAYVAQCEEIDRLRADAERWQWVLSHARWSGFRDCDVAVNVDLWTIEGSNGRKTKTIADCVDDAIAAEKAK